MDYTKTLLVLETKIGRVKVTESYTGETAEGNIRDIEKWIIDISNSFGELCRFEFI